jgi:hypothetical protein
MTEEEGEPASQKSLRSYPRSNQNTFPEYPDWDSRYGSREHQNSIKQQVSPNVGSHFDSRQAQEDIVRATRLVAQIYSSIIDPRNRMATSDRQAVMRYLKVAFQTLLGDEPPYDQNLPHEETSSRRGERA